MSGKVIKSMSEALSTGAAEDYLLQLSEYSEANAIGLAKELAESLNKSNTPRPESKQSEDGKHHYPIKIPSCLQKSNNISKYHREENPLLSAKACT